MRIEHQNSISVIDPSGHSANVANNKKKNKNDQQTGH